MLGFTSRRHPTARIVRVNFNAIAPVELARTLAQDPDIQRKPLYVLIDCDDVRCLRTHGVCHFVSQLLLMRRAGVQIMLHNVGNTLARALRLLHLDVVFELAATSHFRPEYRARPAA
ncbi:hypothetical protein F0P96_07170 [Hymenobacter busanensis]|uniref:Uncharacterized protein n=1 Tax=Hymenobacter busanensis TaxID=2607656 RepID=A0A7L5A3A5_9BACT|nr:STAS domain-containing protein [Hymenobacter busanensis]KAA9338599.1 hypothetical protein F0P96_07170 [Hymenobacter busanensis]QHJ08972.1 hypothetical protein GUY19_17430 [Hymenobacter busanensis]